MRRNRSAASGRAVSLTLGELREATRALPDDVALVVGVRDRHHFDHLLGDLTVSAVAVEHGPRAPVVVLDVEGLS